MPTRSAKQRAVEQIADRIIAYRSLHYGFKPKYIYMTEELHKVLTGKKRLTYEEEFLCIKVKLFSAEGMKFFLVQDVYEVNL